MRWLAALIPWLAPALAVASAPPATVFVSVAPQAGFVERIGGDAVELQVMVPAGHSPATYAPTPRRIAELGQAQLYLRIGVPFEQVWMERIRAANPTMAVIDLRSGLDTGGLPGARDHNHTAHDDASDDGHRHDAHLWTSPPLVRQMAATIRDSLSRLAPANSAQFQANYLAFAAELDALDSDIRTQLAGLTSRQFMVFHPAWGWYAATYDLTQLAIEHQGKAPGARALAAIIEQARRARIRTLIVQPQFDTRLAAQVAAAIDGRVEVCDPLSRDVSAALRCVTRAIGVSRQQ